MYSLSIYESNTAVECHLQQDNKEVRFDATIEIFDILLGTGQIIKFMGDAGADERSRIEATRLLENFIRERMDLRECEIEMGYNGVSSLVIIPRKGAPVYLDYPNNAYGTTLPIYKCENMQSVALCLIKFFITNKYKFTRCKHCGKPFATKNLHTVYCNRSSPYCGYERYTCGEAVDRIKDYLEKRRKSIYEWLRVSASTYGYHTKDGDVTRAFEDKCAEYKSSIRKSGSVDNLLAYDEYLNNTENFPPKYKRRQEVRK